MHRFLVTAAATVAALAAGAAPAAALTPGGDVLALVIDTGINPDHQEFADDQLVGFWDFANPGLLPGPGQRFDPRRAPFDPDGHGTATSAMVGALNVSSEQTPSAAPGVKLAMGKVANDDGAITGDMAAAIRWGVEVLHADAINISIGTIVATGPASPFVLSSDEYAALNEARAAGILVTVSNGNGTGNAGLVPSDGASAGFSSSLDVLAVGASGIDGPLVSQNPEVAAQYAVRTPTPTGTDTYRDIAGTSFSAPFTLGVAVRLMQEVVDANRTLSVADLERLIKGVAKDGPIPPVTEGYGVIDLSVLPAALGHVRAGTLPERPSPDPSGTYVEDVAGAIRAANNLFLPGEYEDPGATAPVASRGAAPAPPAQEPPPPAPAPSGEAGPPVGGGDQPGPSAPPPASPPASPPEEPAPAPRTDAAAPPATSSAPAAAAQSAPATLARRVAPKLGAARALKGSRLRLRGTVDQASTLTFTLRRGGRVLRTVTVRAKPGTFTAALGKRPAKGRYTVTIKATSPSGTTLRTTALRLR